MCSQQCLEDRPAFFKKKKKRLAPITTEQKNVPYGIFMTKTTVFPVTCLLLSLAPKSIYCSLLEQLYEFTSYQKILEHTQGAGT